MAIDKPGIYQMPAEEYHADPCPVPSLSRSIAKKLIDQSPEHAHRKHPRLGGAGDIVPNKAMDMGSAVHTLLLDQGTQLVEMQSTYGPKHERAGEPVDDFMTKAAKEERNYIRERGGVPILKCDMPKIERCAEVAKSKLLKLQDGAGFFAPGQSEAVIAWQEGDIWLRIMVDRLPNDPALPMYDLKITGMSAAPGQWERRLQTEYAFQDAFYRRGLKAVRGGNPQPMRFIVIEDQEPHGTTIQAAADTLQQIADEEVEEAIQTWRRCMRKNDWPGYPPFTAWIEPTSWQMTKHEYRKMRNDFMDDHPTPEMIANIQRIEQQIGGPLK
jgi:PDDEXK-like domain of unknown function (DUF3799)